MRDQTYKQEMREPEPSKHPDERMHWKIKEMRLAQEQEVAAEKKHNKVAMQLAKGDNH